MKNGIYPYRKLYITAIVLVWLGFAVLAPPIAQDPAYHRFAGDGIWNVLTNVPFVAVGAWALYRRAHWTLGWGLVLTGIGSGYYHAAPDDARLVWDRLPMTIVFAGVTAMVLERWARVRALWPLLASGIGSVLWWRETGDLRWYAVVQFGPALILVPAAVSDPAVRGVWVAGVLYGIAKVAEGWDGPIYEAIGVSGHSLKHLLAAGAGYGLVRWSLGMTAYFVRGSRDRAEELSGEG